MSRPDGRNTRPSVGNTARGRWRQIRRCAETPGATCTDPRPVGVSGNHERGRVKKRMKIGLSPAKKATDSTQTCGAKTTKWVFDRILFHCHVQVNRRNQSFGCPAMSRTSARYCRRLGHSGQMRADHSEWLTCRTSRRLGSVVTAVNDVCGSSGSRRVIWRKQFTQSL